jgi:hypothetical protein
MQRRHEQSCRYFSPSGYFTALFLIVYTVLQAEILILGIALIGCILLGKFLIYFKTSQSPVCSVGKTEDQRFKSLYPGACLNIFILFLTIRSFRQFSG